MTDTGRGVAVARRGGARLRSVVIGCTVASAVAAAVSAPVAANMAQPWSPGVAVGEPGGALAGVAIERETLAFDLRPLATTETASVVATYRLRNDGAPTAAELVFVSPQMADGAVTFDGLPVPTSEATGVLLPAGWTSPTAVPAIGGGTEAYESRTTSAYRFAVTIPSGAHELSVRYQVRPGEYHGSGAYHDFQVAYVLAPARAWAAFGTLDVSVDLPPAWEVATSLPMQRSGDRLTATFSGVPADHLGITTRPPVPSRGGIEWLAALALLVATPVLAFLVGRAAASRGGTGVRVLVVLVTAFVSSVALAILLPVAEAMGSAGLAERYLSRTWSYTRAFGAFGLGLVGFALGLVLGTLGAAVGVLLGARRVPSGPPPPLPEWMTGPPPPPRG